MLDNTRGQSFDTLPGKSESPTGLDHCVPRHHSADPFACPCCANVFAETLRLAKVDLAEQAKRNKAANPSAKVGNASFSVRNHHATPVLFGFLPATVSPPMNGEFAPRSPCCMC